MSLRALRSLHNWSNSCLCSGQGLFSDGVGVLWVCALSAILMILLFLWAESQGLGRLVAECKAVGMGDSIFKSEAMVLCRKPASWITRSRLQSQV